MPSPIREVALRSKSTPASVAEPTTFEVADVQWGDGPTIMMKGKTGGGFEKNRFERSRATASIPMESARVLPAGDLEIVVVTQAATGAVMWQRRRASSCFPERRDSLAYPYRSETLVITFPGTIP